MTDDSDEYLTPDTFRELVDPDGVLRCTVCGLREEEIDGRPQLVLYIEEDPRGVIMHRKLYEDLTRCYGHNAVADAFFQRHGLQ